ncbi:MAG TPA: hypothetical protein VM261_28420 [Kofleriaceae bacterium]|nr:hypothetical protein [Kofleriaceae bacterium]
MKPAVHTDAPRRRRRLAVMACLVWLLGVEVLPDAHLATHAWLPAHKHDGDAPVSTELAVTVHADSTAAWAHAHDGMLHQHGAARHADRDRDGIGRSEPAPAPGHGQHSLAHHALALAAPAPAIAHSLPVEHVVVPVHHVVTQLVAIAPPPDAAARAPPV